MSSTMTSTSCAPYQSSPLATRTPPYKEKQPTQTTPSTPRHTAKLWDEYEKRAIENAKRRETTCGTPIYTPQSQRFSNGTVLDIIKSYDPSSSAAASPQFDFGFSSPTHHRSNPRYSGSPATVAICKICKQGTNPSSGVCEACTKTIVLPPPSGESTPLLSPSARNFASTDLPRLHQESTSGSSSPTSSSPKRISQRPPSTQVLNPPIRLSSLRPPPNLKDAPSSEKNPRSRKCSLTDPNEPFLRLQISRKPVPRAHNPSSPTTPPSSSHSHSNSNTSRTRPSSLAPITTPPQYAAYSRHTSATPSEFSTLYPYISNSTNTPPSVCRSSFSPQNTTSAWDDWDSDEEDKAGLVGYWRGKKWRGSRGSLGTSSTKERRDSAGKESGGGHKDEGSGREEGRRKRRGFVRAISCGCGEKER